ncbi:HAD-IA family hydrolase [Hoyosella sp. YIM 151337]|uniref:HAD family hydrolase n=1 Tax=Hoyosella sp. YIM 151337 TaxID=2992742 RepID=UPI00223615AD|nr:HAD-IA family hydrolase [Hoyosella sp. YIM 151337]MCW4352938.1 HAD-IA family hydrolase [Hoyosella sp. YIM 151337]
MSLSVTAQTDASVARIRRSVIEAVIFDLDGVVTDTAELHAQAWAQLFDSYLASRPLRPGEDHSPFTPADYAEFVDGKPRHAGVADFLTARGITVSMGAAGDGTDQETVYGLGRRKDELFLALLASAQVTAYPSTVGLVGMLQRAGLKTGLFSASRNCRTVLHAAGLGSLFPVTVDGVTAVQLGLKGKPDPAVLLETAERLGCPAARTSVVEDSAAGVIAARRGGFGLIIGIDRSGSNERLRHAGADVVVSDAAYIRVESEETSNG